MTTSPIAGILIGTHGILFKNSSPLDRRMDLPIPKKLAPLVEAFYAESPAIAKALVKEAIGAIYGVKDIFNQHRPTELDVEQVCALMESIKPQDTLEAIMAAQIVVSHMLGMYRLSKNHSDDQRLGLKFLNFSMDAMARLQKKRSGGYQNITVNYNYSPHQQAQDCRPETLPNG